MVLIKVECLDATKARTDCADGKDIDLLLDYGTRIQLGRIQRRIENPPTPFHSQYHKCFDLPPQVVYIKNKLFYEKKLIAYI